MKRKEQTIKQKDGSVKSGIYVHRGKKGTGFMVIHNLIGGVNNPIGKQFKSRHDAEKFLFG